MPLWLSSREPSLDTRVYRAMAVGRLLRIVVDNVSTRTKVAAARGFGIGFRRDPKERLLAGRYRTVTAFAGDWPAGRARDHAGSGGSVGSVPVPTSTHQASSQPYSPSADLRPCQVVAQGV